MKTTKWLVAIVLKDWKSDLKQGGRTLSYEEVELHASADMFGARHKGFDQFTARAKYEPAIRKLLEDNNLERGDYCAPDAVEI